MRTPCYYDEDFMAHGGRSNLVGPPVYTKTAR